MAAAGAAGSDLSLGSAAAGSDVSQGAAAAGSDLSLGSAAAAGGDEPSAEIDSRTIEEITVDDFITLYDRYESTWAPSRDYFTASSIPNEIYNVIKYLQRAFNDTMAHRLIHEWRSTEEWPESAGTMVYSLVNLIILQNTTFVPDLLLTYILEEPEERRKQILSTIYSRVYSQIDIFNDYIKKSMRSVSSVVDKKVLYKMPPLSLPKGVRPPILYLFTGIKQVVISDSQLYNFMTSERIRFFPLRSWTVDMRVAMQFTSEDDTYARDGTWEIPGTAEKNEELKQLLNINDPFRLIFITAQEEIFYVTPTSSWEAEVLMPTGRYHYGGHFKKRIKYYSPGSSQQPKLFLFVIIRRIEYTNDRKMNLLQYKKFINEIYDNHFKGQDRITYGFLDDDDDDDEHEVFNPSEGEFGKLESFKHRHHPYGKGSKKYKKKSKKYKKSKKNKKYKSKKYKNKKFKKSKKYKSKKKIK